MPNVFECSLKTKWCQGGLWRVVLTETTGDVREHPMVSIQEGVDVEEWKPRLSMDLFTAKELTKQLVALGLLEE